MSNGEGYFTEEVNSDSENLATEAQIKKIYALLHRLGIDPRDFREERGFTSYAKLTKRQASEMIDELEQQEMVQIEEQLKAGDAERSAAENTETRTTAPQTAPQTASQTTAASAPSAAAEVAAESVAEAEVLRAARLMKRCVSEAKRIVEEEMPFVVSEAIKAKMISSIAATMFIQLGRIRWG